MNSALRKALAGFDGIDVFASAFFPGTEGITFLLAMFAPPQAIIWSVVASIESNTVVRWKFAKHNGKAVIDKPYEILLGIL